MFLLLPDERRPTVNELSNQKGVVQKASGWKLYHMAAQIEDLVGAPCVTLKLGLIVLSDLCRATSGGYIHFCCSREVLFLSVMVNVTGDRHYVLLLPVPASVCASDCPKFGMNSYTTGWHLINA